ncbi:UDP-2,4-diacetamido-2,4,6-trideoxy-beta-L-altropyranose hydrolase [Lysinibacillus xylanilyticus]|uniref:UDP-2,4-diacetamido-2,4, 6-trideoxy-beta-L-altropyranose hydrolase n=1 Tax=Lysinibacillus xylanilyticus TaxID=582475 RepID=UPI003D087C77
MEVYIRTDASIQIGSGHVMRCLTLAHQLKQKGVLVKFLCRELEGNMIEYIRQHDFEVFTLKEIEAVSHWDWTTEHWLEDALETITILQYENQSINLLIIDHYSLDIKWEEQIRPFVEKIMIIDDLADRKHDCDLLLDQNYYIDMAIRYKDLVSEKCLKFLGPNYALLREEFLTIDPSTIVRSGDIRNVLIFFGGTDASGETLKSLYAIEQLIHSDMKVNVVVGASNPDHVKIKHFCDSHRNIQLHCQIDYMAKLMLEADIAIGAGGSASWERIYLKLPAIVEIIADNQKELTEALETICAIHSLGKYEDVKQHDIYQQLKLLMDNPSEVVRMVEQYDNVMDSKAVRKKELVSQILRTIKKT